MVNIPKVTSANLSPRSTIRVISDSAMETHHVEVSEAFSLSEDIFYLNKTIEEIIKKFEENMKTTGHVELLRKKLAIDSGGLNGTLLSADIAKFGNEKKLFISIDRIGDISADTCVLFWIRCPKKIDEEFKDFLGQMLRKNIPELCKSLSRRASLREKAIPYNRNLRKDFVSRN